MLTFSEFGLSKKKSCGRDNAKIVVPKILDTGVQQRVFLKRHNDVL
jgi:hypothetical protein